MYTWVICAPNALIVYLPVYSAMQGRKSMFKHGGDNIGDKYTSRLRDVLLDSGACSPEKKF